MSNETKFCPTCKLDKPLDEFTRRASSKDGRTGQCRVCRAEYRTRAKDKINETQRNYYRNTYRKRDEVKTSSKMRAHTRGCVAKLGEVSDDHWFDHLECTSKQLAEHLQQSAERNGYTDFDIYDYDSKEYHIDHIIPFKMYMDGNISMEKVAHYTNTQILKQKDNLLKGEDYAVN